MGQFHFLLREDQLSRCQISATCSSSRPLSSDFFISLSFTAGFERVCQTAFPVPGLTLYKVSQARSRFGAYMKCHDDIISYLIYLAASSIILSPFQKCVLSAFFFKLRKRSCFLAQVFVKRYLSSFYLAILISLPDFFPKGFAWFILCFSLWWEAGLFWSWIKLTRCILFGSIYCLTCNFFSFSVLWQQ